jgi:hypothetical protein
LLQDLRLAIRSLRATPVVSFVAVLSLALGIGANTAIFSLVDRLILRSLPVREPARLALVATTAQLSYKPNYSYALFDAIAAHTELFDGVLAVSNCCGQSTLAVGDAHEFVDRLFVSGSYFPTLGVNAVVGRVLTPADDELAGGPDGTAVGLELYGVAAPVQRRRRGGRQAGPARPRAGPHRRRAAAVFPRHRSRPHVRSVPARPPRVRRHLDDPVRSALELVEHNRPAEAGSGGGIVGCGASRSGAGASIDDSATERTAS